MHNKNKQPVFLDLTRIHFPVMAVLSIGHRISGVLLFLAVPFAAWLLHRSLESPAGYAAAAAFLDSAVVRVLLALLLWMVAHHFYAGIRYLLMDLDLGVDLSSARRSAWTVIGVAIATLFLGVWLLL
ncbi:MAG: succinate dehydrogenase, cytochrome b556 subunit [Gammaproteobacteria bacterium]